MGELQHSFCVDFFGTSQEPPKEREVRSISQCVVDSDDMQLLFLCCFSLALQTRRSAPKNIKVFKIFLMKKFIMLEFDSVN
jgi:hypothetical protein